MTKYYYADVMPDGRVRACFTYDNPDVGPPTPDWTSQAEGQVVLLDAPISWAGPTTTSVLHMVNGALTWVETATLDEVRADKIVEINNARMTANLSTFTYSGKEIACDTLSRSDIDGTNGYVSLFGTLAPNWKGAWKAKDNSYVPIATVDDWKAFYSAMVQQGQQNFDHAQSLKSAVASATTIDQVNAIHW